MGHLVEREIPANALIKGLRAVGYNFSTAVADIIDNSISAAANRIDIFSNPLAQEPYFCILDDGCGMDCDELDNAMLLGSDRSKKPDSEQELGRFGLGLKSASLSQCKKFTVASKKNGCLNAMTFNLDIVEQTNKLQLIVLDSSDIAGLPEIDELKKYNSGTLVVWNEFDRIEDSAKKFENSFRSIVSEAKKHVEFVFHRFYDDVEVYFDKLRIDRRDPFLSNSYGRQQTGRATEIFENGSKIMVTPHTLPYMDSMTLEEKALLGNPKSIYDEQGFYLYRNKRLISWGGWMHMSARSELNKLARVQIDIPSSLDSIWSLDVKKSSAKIPDKLKDRIKIALEDSVARSRKATRFPGLKEQSIENKVWDSVIDRENHVKYQINRENPLIRTLMSCLGKKGGRLLEILLSQIESYLPQKRILKDNADSMIIENSGDHVDEEDLIKQIEAAVAMTDPQTKKIMLECLLLAEPYQKLCGKADLVRRRVLDEN